MKTLQTVKRFAVTPPAAIVDNAAVTTATIDTLGFRELEVLIFLGATDIAVAAMKLRQSDDSGMSGAADVAGADFSVLPLTLPSATDDNKFFSIHVDLRGKKRYMDLTLTGGDGSAGAFFTVIALLAAAEDVPSTAAERGVSQEAIV